MQVVHAVGRWGSSVTMTPPLLSLHLGKMPVIFIYFLSAAGTFYQTVRQKLKMFPGCAQIGISCQLTILDVRFANVDCFFKIQE